jgi:tRNA(fMet)-specific endonuclease VapC
MDAALLDTDILSEVLKRRNATVALNAPDYLRHHLVFTISSIIRYEVRRGHLSKNAHASLTRFDRFCQMNQLIGVTVPILDRAAELWASAQRGGHPCGDADLIIAATALESDLVLVTGNTPHFSWIPGLRLQDWRLP